MFSSTVSAGTTLSSWSTSATPTRCAAWRLRRSTGSPVDEDAAGVGRELAGQHLDDRALPGAVVPAHGVDLAGADA